MTEQKKLEELLEYLEQNVRNSDGDRRRASDPYHARFYLGEMGVYEWIKHKVEALIKESQN